MSNLTKSIPADERKMLRKAFWRSFTLYAAVSPAKQGASGFCYSLMPFINKFYKNDEEGKKAALTRSMSYFNTTITCIHIHHGSCGFHGEEKQRAEGF
ncbi:MAG: PTS system mannose/fructose/sorbose family transporter subunit IID [Blautia massiliensis (ex Durand et al. 2017)]